MNKKCKYCEAVVTEKDKEGKTKENHSICENQFSKTLKANSR